MERRRLTIHGRVQGVFFRETVRRAAERHGVAGTATNREDGSVEVVLEGDGEAVRAVEETARQGPRGARVDRVEAVDERPEGLSGFESR